MSRVPFLLIFLLVLYLVEFLIMFIFGLEKRILSSTIDLVLFLSTSIWYLWRYRKGNLLCFELFFLPVYFLSLFYSDIILGNLGYEITDGIGGAFRNAVSQTLFINKSRLIQILAYYVFLIGCVYANNQPYSTKESWKDNDFSFNINNNMIMNVVVLLLMLEIVIQYMNGSFDTWFSYTQGLGDNKRNQGLNRLSTFCFIGTVVEFFRLAQNGVNSLGSYLRHCNKVYLFSILFISVLLIVSGNRNEMLLIFMPFVVAYSVMIKRIKDKHLLLGLVLGVVVMIIIGLIRDGSSMQKVEFKLYESTRDYSLVGINCDYLVKYTDEKSPMYFSELFQSVVSGIPYVGPQVVDALGLKFEDQSTMITTSGMASWDGTGLGTSIIGDLYYNAKLPFVLIFMSLLGYFISRLHIRFTQEKKFSLIYFFIYLYLTSNAVYFIRQQWDFPISRIMYDYIILLILTFLFGRLSKNKIVKR